MQLTFFHIFFPHNHQSDQFNRQFNRQSDVAPKGVLPERLSSLSNRPIQLPDRCGSKKCIVGASHCIAGARVLITGVNYPTVGPLWLQKVYCRSEFLHCQSDCPHCRSI
ncbi:hypothetical protein AMTR_s00133p00111400 [Amborella trichopoda]|uniref:Uncharacterized protein n=1 Tax=Amborella trichopoda TaxID=13333 RepID=W1P9T3_AMBTC|nr:hypothetical protein AMTR_s00133p00111400 [Amborella trichopoda]